MTNGTRTVRNRIYGAWAQLNESRSPYNMGVRTGRSSSQHPNRTQLNPRRPARWFDGILTDNIPDYTSQLAQQYSATTATVCDFWVGTLKPIAANARDTLISRNNSGEDLYTPELFYEYKRWIMETVQNVVLPNNMPNPEVTEQQFSDATWCLLAQAMRIYHTDHDSITIITNDVVGKLFPGMTYTVPMSNIDRYRYSGFSAIFRSELVTLTQQYQRIYSGAVVSPGTTAESRRMHIGIILWQALCNSFSRLMRDIPELPEYAAFDLCRRAAHGAVTAVQNEPSLTVFHDNSSRTFVSMHTVIEHAMLGDIPPRPEVTSLMDVDILAGQIDYAQRIQAHMQSAENQPGYGYDITADQMSLTMSLALADTRWSLIDENADLRGAYIDENGSRRDIPSALLHTIANDVPFGLLGVNPDYREQARWCVCALVTVAAWERALPDDQVTSAGGEHEEFPVFPEREHVIWDPTGPQIGEVWGNLDEPLTWIYLSSRNPDDRFVTVSFDAEGILQGVGELTQAEVPMSGRVRIFPPVERRAALPVGFGRRAVRLRNGLQLLAIDE